MVGRPVDHRRREELLEAAVDHAAQQGFAELSLRSVAAALGVSTTALVHHFGTKEQLLQAVLGKLRLRMSTVTDDLAGNRLDLAATARAIWAASSDPREGPTFRLFFAVYGQALQAPERFDDFLDAVGKNLMTALCAAQGPDVDPASARATATLVIATMRGLLLDLLACEDPERVHRAAESFLRSLENVS